ncbi:NADP-dependent oxidoreductase domain-containing protein [Naematelia encephala]|uniref:NADP-dependent oxidoreductase domain-containing protein n=1 Tax=Naematelia encephala TaxID=71784 RepID=A0A1Y2BN42_9TREE|nr:NADP-dependent oxidoreductase domain-containing protein [Naematelia encephala]
MFSPKRPAKRLPQVKLGKVEVPRLFFGLWQLSSSAWGAASQEQCEDALSQLLSHGFTAADMADHYADAELLFGRFRSRLSFPAQREPTVVATKYCQFAPIPADQVIDRDWALERVLERSRRIGGTVDLLQVHWQHLDDERYLDVFAYLVDIAATRPELVTAIGLCNFDADTTAKICEHLLAVRGEVGIVSNQIQYSLVDQRPRFAMAKVCEKYGIKLLTYGTFCGGFLSSKWVGKPEPSIYAGDLNTSQRKYYDMIRAWGGWDLFQSLLRVLQTIGDKYHVDVSNIAARWILDRPETGVVIIGSRLGVSEHVESSLKTFDFELIDEDRAEIENVLDKSRAKDMFEQIGDCGLEYR